MSLRCKIQHVNRSSASNVNNIARLQLIAQIHKPMAMTLQIIRQKIPKKYLQRIYIVNEATRNLES